MAATDLPILLAHDLEQLASVLIDMLEHPAAVVIGGEYLLACNDDWARATRSFPREQSANTLECSLRGLLPIGPLKNALSQGAPISGTTPAFEVVVDDETVKYVARWHQIILNGDRRSIAVVVLHEPSQTDPLKSIISSQRARLDHLLNRQTLIEETERRRVGQALHDVTSQSLALIRMRIANDDPASCDKSMVLNMLDQVIEDTRTLAFELSPPILEDLGLRQALVWLAEHLSKRYDAEISVTDGADESCLTHSVRTIVFRAVRELVINAVKHAPGASIDISCTIEGEVLDIAVHDDGPGFDAESAMARPSIARGYGLLSVEQQIQGVGGRFTLSSSPEGTRASITIPIPHRSCNQE